MVNVLNFSITPHREFLPANRNGQKLFVMVKLQPSVEVAQAVPPTAFTFLIDTSGSMDDHIVGTQSKRDLVIDALKSLIRSGKLRPQDRVSIVRFDDEVSTVLPLTTADRVNIIEPAIDQLRKFSGGTLMGQGLKQTFGLLSGEAMTCRRVILLTDGETFDEEQCHGWAKQCAQHNIPITALGVGDFNEDLLNSLSDTTGGRAFHVVNTEAEGSAVPIQKLPHKVLEEFELAQQEVINNLKLNIKTVQGVQVKQIVRAYPSQANLAIDQSPYVLGNIIAQDQTVFIIEFELDTRPLSRIRLAQLGLTYDIPGQNRRGELPPQNLVVEFAPGEQLVAQIDQEVMQYVQQANISTMIEQAASLANSNPDAADRLLTNAQKLTEQIGNVEMSESLLIAQGELRKTKRISDGTRKTIKMASRGKTVKMDTQQALGFSEEEIRQASGT
jgi:Ca-activated chloride channel homolog